MSGQDILPPPRYTERQASPPPAYAEQDAEQDAGQDERRTRRILQVYVDPGRLAVAPSKLESPHVVVHLKLLYAIHNLYLNIRNTHNLWNLSDAFLPATPAVNPKAAIQTETARQRVRDKRWAVFVTRAVTRFEKWWAGLYVQHGNSPLKMEDLASPHPILSRHSQPEDSGYLLKEQLPPLDVLMVWHAYMLNPRRYLEDCLRKGMMRFWHQGMPWAAVNAALDESESYNPGVEARSNWARITDGYHWSNLEDSLNISVICPSCNWDESTVPDWIGQPDTNPIKIGLHSTIPWTTVGNDLQAHAQELKGLAIGKDANRDRMIDMVDKLIKHGRGYADASFLVDCQSCGAEINHAALRANKFAHDLMGFYRERTAHPSPVHRPNDISKVVPMPGTVLNANGRPDCTGIVSRDARLFPNRLCDAMLNHGPLALKYPYFFFTMDHMQGMVTRYLDCRDVWTFAQGQDWRGRLVREESRAVRNMFSCYLDNSSPFALDLVGAVTRQGSFVNKMAQLDWLYLPGISATTSCLIDKYSRFMTIVAADPLKLAVPTLDVDLAWHTHQLAPALYYQYSIEKTKGTFVDHDNKVAETILSDAFARTSRQYERFYKELYSHCVCWYCESIRASYTPSATARLLRRGSSDKVAAQLRSAPSDPDCSAHISAHSAIRPRMKDDFYRKHAVAYLYKLRAAYETACKDARKDGRPEPELPSGMLTSEDRFKRRDKDKHVHAFGFGYIGGIRYYGYELAPYMCDYAMTDDAYASSTADEYVTCCQGRCGGIGSLAGYGVYDECVSKGSLI